MEVLLEWVGTYGIQSVLCFYVLMVTNTKIDKMTDTIAELSKAISNMEVKKSGSSKQTD